MVPRNHELVPLRLAAEPLAEVALGLRVLLAAEVWGRMSGTRKRRGTRETAAATGGILGVCLALCRARLSSHEGPVSCSTRSPQQQRTSASSICVGQSGSDGSSDDRQQQKLQRRV